MAFSKTEIRAIRGNVVDMIYGTTEKSYMLVEIKGTTDGTGNTYDITDDLDYVTGIVGPVLETVDEAVAATASTWSSTTVTFAGHTGSGRYRGVFLVEV